MGKLYDHDIIQDTIKGILIQLQVRLPGNDYLVTVH